MKAQVDFTIKTGKGERTVVRKGEEIPREVRDQAARSGYAATGQPAAAKPDPSGGEKPSRRRTRE